MTMMELRSNSYEQLEQMLDQRPPGELLTTRMVINGQAAVSGLGQSTSEVQQELADLVRGAEAFDVLITNLFDEVENMALVALRGKASDLADLAAFMTTTKAAAGAR